MPQCIGSAQRVAVLSALVVKNAKSLGCHRPWITLSLCSATTIIGNGWVKSPERGEIKILKYTNNKKFYFFSKKSVNFAILE